MIDDLLVSPRTKKLLAGYVREPGHALLLVGTEGLGVDKISKILAAGLLGYKSVEQLANSSQVMPISPNENGNISIDEIREAWRYSRVPASASDGKTKVVIVSKAEALTREAQNSFLKLLEEPPDFMHFILTSLSVKLLLPTIESRVQTIAIKSPPDEEVLGYLSKKFGVEKSQARQAWIMSAGEPYVALQIIESGGSEDLDLAKHMLSLKPYQRVTESNELLKDREKALALTQNITRLAYLATTQSVKTGKDGTGWLRRLKLSQETAGNLRANANVRLNMINLLSNL